MSVSEAQGHKKPPRPQESHHVGCLISTVLLLSILVGGTLFFLIRSGGNASGPAARQETPTPSPTAIVTATPPSQSLFYDTFADNNHGWSITDDPGNSGYVREIANNELTLIDINPKTTLIESLPTTEVFADCMVTVDFTIVSTHPGDSVGVYVHGDSNLDHDYRVDLNGNNTYDIAKEYLDFNQQPQSSYLDGPESSPAIHPMGQQNKMTVILKGSTIVLMINNTRVSTVTDNDYSSGQIALFARVGPSSSGVTTTFSKVEVDPAPAQLPE